MSKPKALVTDLSHWDQESFNIIGERFEVLEFTSLGDKESSCEIIFTKLEMSIDSKLMDKLPHLKTIATPTTGLNHIDIHEASHRGIMIISLKGEYAFLEKVNATAELTWALLLALIRKLPTACSDLSLKKWDRNPFKGIELHEKNLGVIGLGRLGTKIARFGNAFGMHVVACDPAPSTGNPDHVELVSLDELLIKADIISIHVNYCKETVNLLGKEQFSMMKPGVILINTSRGGIVNENALLARLSSGKIGGAALDVLEGEYSGAQDWTFHDPLIAYADTHDNLLITPHVGGLTFESTAMTERFIVAKAIEKHFLHNEAIK